MPEVSVIVPVYKTEEFLPRCVDSVLAQTFTDFELILVDDGSPDDCPAICDAYAKKDSRVRVIHQKNGGAAAARNRALDSANGEYIAFCDSDDEVSPHWLSRLLAFAAEDTLPVCAYCLQTDELGKEKTIGFFPGKKLSKEAYLTLNQLGLAGFLWNAFFSKKKIQDLGLRFRENKEKGDYNEDLLFALEYVRRVSYVIYTGYADYCYRTREGSLSHSGEHFYFEKYKEKYVLWRDFAQEINASDKWRSLLANQYLFHFIHALVLETEKNGLAPYSRFRCILLSTEMQECVQWGDVSRENPFIIQCIKKKAALLAWGRLKISRRLRK